MCRNISIVVDYFSVGGKYWSFLAMFKWMWVVFSVKIFLIIYRNISEALGYFQCVDISNYLQQHLRDIGSFLMDIYFSSYMELLFNYFNGKIYQIIYRNSSEPLVLLVHACNHSATQNIATSVEEAFIMMINNCSLPHSNDYCHQNWKTTFGNTVSWTPGNKFEFLILNRLMGRKYLWLIDVSFQYKHS